MVKGRGSWFSDIKVGDRFLKGFDGQGSRLVYVKQSDSYAGIEGRRQSRHFAGWESVFLLEG